MNATSPTFVVTVEVTPTVEDVKQFLRCIGKRRVEQKSWIYSSVVVLVCIGFFYLLEHATNKPPSSHLMSESMWQIPEITSIWFWVMLGFLGLFIFAIYLGGRSRIRAFNRFASTVCTPLRLQISDERILASQAGGSVEWKWSALTGFHQEGDAVVLLKEGAPVLWWMSSWFDDPEDAERVQAAVVAKLPRQKTPVVQ